MSSTLSVKELRQDILDQVESIKEKLTDKEYKDILDLLMKLRVEENRYIINYLVLTPKGTTKYEPEDEIDEIDEVVIVSHPFRETVILTDEEFSNFDHFRYTQCMSRDFRNICKQKCWNIWKELDSHIIVNSVRNEEEISVPVKVVITNIEKLN